MIIKNREALTSHGNVDGRKIVLEMLEAGFVAADPYENTKKLIRVRENTLIVNYVDYLPEEWRRQTLWGTRSSPPTPEPLVFDLSKIGAIYVVGGGKAAQRMGKALEDVLGDLITEGHINAKKGEKVELERIGLTLGGHPIPDEDGVEGSKRILEIEKKAKKDDIVLLSESGGGSSLMTLPVPGVSLEDVQEVNRLLYFECGSSMQEINAVRWQLMYLRGRHGRHVGDATLIGIHTSEEPADMPVRAKVRPSGTNAYKYAIKLLKRYEIWNDVPQSVRAFLLKADPKYDVLQPGELKGKPQYHFRVMGPEYMLEAARNKAENLGINPNILVASLNNMEACDAAKVLAHIAREIEVYKRPFKPPCVLLCGGEILVTVGKEKGIGGRNQEFVLSTVLAIDGSKNIVIGSADSDGRDGPSIAAGGIVDGYTLQRIEQAGLDILEELRRHNSYEALKKIEDNIITGVQGTNVRDLRVIYIDG
jgi:glycerate-2-kinase